MSSSSENGDNPDDKLVPSDLLKKALIESLSSILGPTLMDDLMEDLRSVGILIDDKDEVDVKYSIGDIHKRLVVLFGEDAAELLMEKIRKAIF